MADQQPPPPSPPPDWREWLTQAERQWNSFFNTIMGNDQFGPALAQFMNMQMAAQKSMGEAMERYTRALNPQAGGDSADYNQRLAAIEERLGRLEAGAPRTGPSRRKSPPRTKRPPSQKV